MLQGVLHGLQEEVNSDYCYHFLIVVARIIFGPELGYYDALRDVLPFVLLSISFLLLATETTRLDFPRWVRRATRNKLGKDSRFAGFLAATGFFYWPAYMDGECSNYQLAHL